MINTDTWITSSELWSAVELAEGSAFGLGERLRPWLNADKIGTRAEVIVRNDVDRSARPNKNLPRSILSSIRDESLFLGSDRLAITVGGWAGETVVFEAVGLSFDRRSVYHALQLPSEPRKPAGSSRPSLPAQATGSHRAHEDAAHSAAQLVRDGLTIAEAARRVRPSVSANGRAESSIDRAVRDTLRLMYDQRGNPIQP